MTQNVVPFVVTTAQTPLLQVRVSLEPSAHAKTENLQPTDALNQANQYMFALITNPQDALLLATRRFAFTCQMANNQLVLSDLLALDTIQLTLINAADMEVVTAPVSSRIPLTSTGKSTMNSEDKMATQIVQHLAAAVGQTLALTSEARKPNPTLSSEVSNFAHLRQATLEETITRTSLKTTTPWESTPH